MMNGHLAVTAHFSSVPSEQNLLFLPSDDGYVKSGSILNFGERVDLKVRLGGTKFRSFLKFQIVDGPAVIKTALLRLFVTDAGPDGGSLYLVTNEFQSSGGPWQESGLIWNNAPVLPETPLQLAGPVEVDTWITFDVTEFVTGDGIYSFALEEREGQNK